MDKIKNYYYYCDGASRNNGGKDPSKEVLGSFGGILVNSENKICKMFSKTYKNVTNNQMELLGFIAPISFITKTLDNINKSNENINITIISDSQYLIKGITEWLNGWKKRGWRNSSGKIIENIEMWKLIDEMLKNNKKYHFDFIWVKGHSKDPEKFSNEYYNDICDKLANKSIDKYLNNKKEYNLIPLKEELKLIEDYEFKRMV